jgi:hypothetical protein
MDAHVHAHVHLFLKTFSSVGIVVFFCHLFRFTWRFAIAEEGPAAFVSSGKTNGVCHN